MKIKRAIVEVNTPEELKPYVDESVTDPQALGILFDKFKHETIGGDILKKFKVVNIFEFADMCITHCDPIDLAEMLRDVVGWGSTPEEIIGTLLDNTSIEHWVLDHNGKESIDANLDVMYLEEGWCE